MKDEEKLLPNEQGDIAPEAQPDEGLTPEQQAILSLKKNTVSKEKYEEMEKKYNNFVAAVIDGKELPENARGVNETPDVQELRKKLSTEGISNLEYARTALALRKAVMEKDGDAADPFVPHGAKINATAEDYEKAQNVADVLQDCIDRCDDDSGVFTVMLQSRMKDTSPLLGAASRSNRRK